MEEAALALGIGQLLDRPTHELSGGELQRVALGAALAGRPRVVLLDEPTSQLDPVAGDELLGVLRRLNEEWGTAVLLAEHRLERCLQRRRPRVALRDGAVACDADPRGVPRLGARHAPELQTPGARLFALAGLRPLPVSVKEARARARRARRPAPERAPPSRAGAAAARAPQARRAASAAPLARRGRVAGAQGRAGGPARRVAASCGRASGSR